MTETSQPAQFDAKKHQQQKEKREEILAKQQKMFRDSDSYFKLAGLSTLICIVICFYNYTDFREKAKSLNIYIVSVQSLWYCLAGFFYQWIARKFFFKLMEGYYSKHLHPKNEQYTPEQRYQRLFVGIKQGFDGIYNLAMCIIFFYVYRKQAWFPTVLGGEGSCVNIFKDYPTWPTHRPYFFEAFYQFQLGAYIYYAFDLLYLDRQRYEKHNFGQLLYHHFISATLILFSMLFNFCQIGSTVLFAHDSSDILRGFSRLVGQSKLPILYPKFAHLLNWIYLLMWIYMRLLVLPFCLIESMWDSTPIGDHEWNIVVVQHICLTFLSLAIFFIQSYWTVMIYKLINKQKDRNQFFVEKFDTKKEEEKKE